MVGSCYCVLCDQLIVGCLVRGGDVWIRVIHGCFFDYVLCGFILN